MERPRADLCSRKAAVAWGRKWIGGALRAAGRPRKRLVRSRGLNGGTFRPGRGSGIVRYLGRQPALARRDWREEWVSGFPRSQEAGIAPGLPPG